MNVMAGFNNNRRSDSVFCPKPRKIDDNIIRPICWNNRMNHSEMSDLKARAELLDIILSKGSGAERSSNQVASSPPFFCGSPPSRISNPQVHDEHFGLGNFNPFSPASMLTSSPSSSSTHKGGCSRSKFSPNSAAVRIEGFDCLNRDMQNCSIFAVA